ncbi:MAG TPA: isoprenylcysteine carboxylmethyltransferase family protein [Terracidiphilus sp.]|jgi:protein-S-isoprenylcysteine O-methyltransferase Ste14|nr:isoprenylcysteine carboxylmethyltransferase family protein [Terracidiphilus sp.]
MPQHFLQLALAQFGPLQLIAFGEVAVCWIVWIFGFLRPRKLASGQTEILRAPASRWGIFFNFIGFGCIFVYVRPTDFVKTVPELVAAMALAPISVLLSWRATRHLGKQWRFQAAISEGHILVKTGPYARLRHPIYASMLGLILSVGLIYTWWPMIVAGMLFLLIGIEIRVQAEERLLEQYFQDEFLEWRGRTKAYIPLIR